MRPKRQTIAIALLAAASPAAAMQAQSNGVVGPAEIRDFSLPGTPPPVADPTPTPAPAPPEEPTAEPQPPAPTPAPASETPAPPARTEPEARNRSRPDEAEEEGRRQVAPAAEPDADAAPDRSVPEPAATPDEVPVAAAEPALDPAPAPSTNEPQGDGGSDWLLPLLGALALLGGLFAFWRYRTRREEGEQDFQPILEAEPAPAAALPEPAIAPEPLAAAPVAAASDVPGIVLRPWLELDFKPARATATDGGASVQYQATIRNVGNAPARNVRLAASMFNSGSEIQSEVANFFAMGVDTPDGAPLTILPRTEISLSSVVTMAREDMREVKVQGRSLFIPTVAFNLLYDWGRDKTGQTCSAHVVGREPETPSAKMAPFRLDLGPRVYRSVGQRPSALARAV